MSLAWEVTDDDVSIVLDAHDSKADVNESFNEIDGDIIEDAVLEYTDFDEQCCASLAGIEDQLIEAGILSGKKKFKMP